MLILRWTRSSGRPPGTGLICVGSPALRAGGGPGAPGPAGGSPCRARAGLLAEARRRRIPASWCRPDLPSLPFPAGWGLTGLVTSASVPHVRVLAEQAASICARPAHTGRVLPTASRRVPVGARVHRGLTVSVQLFPVGVATDWKPWLPATPDLPAGLLGAGLHRGPAGWPRWTRGAAWISAVVHRPGAGGCDPPCWECARDGLGVPPEWTTCWWWRCSASDLPRRMALPRARAGGVPSRGRGTPTRSWRRAEPRVRVAQEVIGQPEDRQRLGADDLPRRGRATG